MWTTDRYDQLAGVQPVACGHLIRALQTHATNLTQGCRIVDLGCGTGSSTRLLHTHFQPEILWAIDCIATLLERARINSKQWPSHLNSHIHWIAHDFETGSPQAVEQPDLIFANFALHWGRTQSRFFEAWVSQSADNALFAFSVPVQGTFAELSQNQFPFLTATDWLKVCLSARLTPLFETIYSFQEHFLSPWDVLHALRDMRVHCYPEKQLPKGLSRPERLKNFFKGSEENSYTLTYQVYVALFEKS